jgi:hypothetical protein
MTDQPATSAALEDAPSLPHARTSLLPPAPGRHHWCVVVPASHQLRFDGEEAVGAELVEQLWVRGLGAARFDLVPPSADVVAAHPAAFGRQLKRTADVLERLHRLDRQAEVTLLAEGDAVDVALAIERIAAGQPWPAIRGLLLVPPGARPAAELAWAVAQDECLQLDVPRPGVTERLRRRLGR